MMFFHDTLYKRRFITIGAIEAEVDKETAVQQKTIAAYGQTALTAFKEIETALAGEDHLAKREVYLQTVVEENVKAYGLVKTQFEVGQIDMLDLLAVQSK